MRRILLFIVFLLGGMNYVFSQQGGYALEFNGSDSYVDCGTSSNFELSTLTIEAWVKLETAGVFQAVISKLESSTSTTGYELAVNSSNQVELVVGNSDEVMSELVASTTLTTGVWYHIAGTYDGEIMKVYVNGVLSGTTTLSDVITNSSEALTIGRRADGSNYFSGVIDEVRVWNSERNESEIKANMFKELVGDEDGLLAYYTMSDGIGEELSDVSTNDYTGTLTNSPSWVASGCFAGPRNALSFDGDDDYVDLGTPSELTELGETSYTIEAWIKTSVNTSRQTIIGNYDGTPSWVIEVYSAGNLRMYVNNTGYNSTAVVADGNWHHIAGVRDLDNDIIMYVDGVEVYNYGSDPEGSFTTTYSTRIGENPSSGYALPFEGEIEDVRIWNEARSQSEIQDNMMKTLDGDETGLVAYYRFDQEDGATLYDITSNGNNGTLNNMDDEDWVSSNAFNTWLGGESSDWTTATNWSNGAVSSDDNVGIYSWTVGNELNINDAPEVNNMVISSSASPTLSSVITVNGNLIVNTDMDLNGQVVTLGSDAYLVENEGAFTGTKGSITTTRTLNDVDENVAGLGAVITTSADMGSTTITRSHAEAEGTLTTNVLRQYEIVPTNNTGLSATLEFTYRSEELNELAEDNLVFAKTEDSGSTWDILLGTVSTEDNTATLTDIDSFNKYTLTVESDPAVTTQDVSDITSTTALGNGDIADLGNPNSISSYGVCWNTSGTPTVEDSYSDEGGVTVTGDFETDITSLSPNTTYYVRSYVINSLGTIYGDEVSFTTLKQFTVTFVDYDGTTVLSTQTVDYGSAATAPEEPTREGYSFEDWDVAYSNITSDLTVTAAYTINSYTVTFVDYDGTTVLSTQTVDYGSAATAPEEPIREGYSFEDWDVAYSNITSDLTVTAQYSITSYSITYNLDEGTNDESNPSEYTIESYDITLQDATKTGYTFAGWYSDESLTTEVTVISQGHTGDVELWAKWTVTTSISFEKNTVFKVYPNPASSIIYVDGVEGIVSIYNVSGKKVLTYNLSNGNSIDISGLSKGIYILNVNGENKKVIKR